MGKSKNSGKEVLKVGNEVAFNRIYLYYAASTNLQLKFTVYFFITKKVHKMLFAVSFDPLDEAYQKVNSLESDIYFGRPPTKRNC